MPEWFGVLIEIVWQRCVLLLGRGASVKTGDFQITAATAEDVVRIMRSVHELSSSQPLPRLANGDSIPLTVQAEEPMTVKG